MIETGHPSGMAENVQPLVTALEHRTGHAIGIHFVDDVDVLKSENLAGADDRADVVGILEVLHHQSEMPRALSDEFFQQILALFRELVTVFRQFFTHGVLKKMMIFCLSAADQLGSFKRSAPPAASSLWAVPVMSP